MLKASANCFVKTHKVHRTKYDDSGMKPKLTPEKRESPHFYIPSVARDFKLFLFARGARSCFFVSILLTSGSMYADPRLPTKN